MYAISDKIPLKKGTFFTLLLFLYLEAMITKFFLFFPIFIINLET